MTRYYITSVLRVTVMDKQYDWLIWMLYPSDV